MVILIKSYYGINQKYSASQKRVSEYVIRLLNLNHKIHIQSFDNNPNYGDEWCVDLSKKYSNFKYFSPSDSIDYSLIDVVWLTDLWLERTLAAGLTYASDLKQQHPNVTLVYDAVDCIAKTQSGYADPEHLKLIAHNESALHHLADLSILVSESEREEVISRYQIQLGQCLLISTIHACAQFDEVKPFEARTNFCFVGADSPSTYDSLNIIKDLILPKARLRLPSIQIDLIGTAFSGGYAQQHYANIDGLNMVGAVNSIFETVQNYHALVVPFKTSIGVRGRILETMGAGTPVITTTSGCSGMNFQMHADIFVADHIDSFVDCMQIAQYDAFRWREVAQNGLVFMHNNYAPSTIDHQLVSVLHQLTKLKSI
jgi:glycosyltransferase involved in cell wall biosynthesis